MYIKVNKEDLSKIEDLMNENNISYTSNVDPLYFTIEERMNQIIENNIFINNIKDIDDALQFVYDDFNPLSIDEVIMDKLIIYDSENGAD